MSKNVLDILESRGYVHQHTNRDLLYSKFGNEQVVAYVGFDCTAISLHVGSLMQLMIMRLLQKHGHKPIIILGGGTTRIGDPSDKEVMRPKLSIEKIQENKKGIVSVIGKFLDFSSDSPSSAVMVDNALWLEDIGYIDFIDIYGRHFSINRMLSFDSVKLRLEREQHMTFLEFNYMLLQAYDFLELHRRYNCFLQIGGSEQWGNIVSGIELARKIEKVELCGMTTPLITTSSGAKMGKTVSGAVWLSDDMLSSYDYWQFWRNVDDGDVLKFLKLYTEVPVEEIDEMKVLKGADLNKAKILLADCATAICHGKDAADEAKEVSLGVFEKNVVDDTLLIHEFDKSFIGDGVQIWRLLVESKLSPSASEAKKMIQGGGMKFNNNLVEDYNLLVRLEDFSPNNKIQISLGKKRYFLLGVK